MLVPTPHDHGFDYMLPEGIALPAGALVEVNFTGRTLVGLVLGAGKSTLAAAKIKPVLRVLELPAYTPAMLAWLKFMAEYTLAPLGLVFGLTAAAAAAKTTRSAYKPPVFTPNMAVLSPEQKQAADTIIAGKAGEIFVLDGITGSGKTEVYFAAIAAVLSGECLVPSASPLLLPPLAGGEKVSESTRVAEGEPRSEGVANAVGEGRRDAPLERAAQTLILLPEIALTHQWLSRFRAAFGAKPVVWHSGMSPAARTRAWQTVVRGEAPVVVGARSALCLPFANLTLLIVDEEHDASYKQDDGVLYHARDMAVARAKHEGAVCVLASATPSLETVLNVEQGKYRALHLPERHGGAQLPEVSCIDMRLETLERDQFISPTLRNAVLETLARGEQALLFMNRRGYAPLTLCRACGHRFECPHCSAWMVTHRKGVAHKSEDTVRSALSRAASEAQRGGLGAIPCPQHAKNAHEILLCHHCGHKEPAPTCCPACGADETKLAACGPGVERIAEEVARWGIWNNENEDSMSEPALSHAHGGGQQAEVGANIKNYANAKNYIVLSSDSPPDEATMQQIIAGEIPLLIGTQMVAKGHHFPHLTLVGVVDADLGLDGGDLRVSERAYQMLHQLAGRAGRAEKPGRVLLQTYQPEHKVMVALAHSQAPNNPLLETEKTMRAAGNWPPYGQLAAILLDGPNALSVLKAGQSLVRRAPTDTRLSILGPAPAPMSKLKGQFRYRILVKATREVQLQKTLRAWLADAAFKGVRIKLDVNPYAFM